MFQFGIGGMFAIPVAGNYSGGPVRFGTIQDVSVEFSGKNVALRGQNKFPDDVAPSDVEIKGKAAFGRLDVSYFNLMFGETPSTATKEIVDSETGTVPATPYQITVAGAATFFKDLGVRLASNGDEYVKVASAPATGQYSVDETTGVYTFAAADTTFALLISYQKTGTAGKTLTVTNRIQGYGPVFELVLNQNYQGANSLRLYRCRASKTSMPHKRDGYVISDFEFECFADPAGNVFTWYTVTP